MTTPVTNLPYNPDNMSEAVAYKQKTDAAFAAGKQVTAYRMWLNDPNGGAASGVRVLTQDEFNAAMYSMRDVQGNFKYPQPLGYTHGQFTIGQHVQVGDGKPWGRVEQIAVYELDKGDQYLTLRYAEPVALQDGSIGTKEQIRADSVTGAVLTYSQQHYVNRLPVAGMRYTEEGFPYLGTDYQRQYVRVGDQIGTENGKLKLSKADQTFVQNRQMEPVVGRLYNVEKTFGFGDGHWKQSILKEVIPAKGQHYHGYDQFVFATNDSSDEIVVSRDELGERVEGFTHLNQDKVSIIHVKNDQLDSVYPNRSHAQSALDAIDRVPLTYYAVDGATGERFVSFSGKSELMKKGKSVDQFFQELDDANKPEFTNEHRKAVTAFRDANGRSWKSKLNECWITGNYRGVPSEHTALLQQVRNRLGPEWLANANPADFELTKRELSLFMTFDNRDVTRDIYAIQKATAYQPKWWNVTQEDRNTMKRLISVPHVIGGSVRFDLAVEGSPEQLQNLSELASELARKSHDKDFLLPNGEKVHCKLAVGGFKEDVHSAMREMAAKANDAVVPASADKSYLVSVYAEKWNPEALDAGEPMSNELVKEREVFDDEDLMKAGRQYGIDSASSQAFDDPYVWFKSSSSEESQEHFEQGIDTFYALHIHEVNGQEPTADDLREVARKLGIGLDKQLDVTSQSTDDMSL